MAELPRVFFRGGAGMLKEEWVMRKSNYKVYE